MSTPSVSPILQQWYETGIRKGASHLIVAISTYDWDSYPVYVTDGRVQDAADKVTGRGDRLSGCTDLSLPLTPENRSAW